MKHYGCFITFFFNSLNEKMQPTPGHQSITWPIFYFTLSLAAGKIKAFQGLSSAINPLGRRRKEKKQGVGGGQRAWKILRNCLWVSFSCEISLKSSPWLISFMIPFKSIVWADFRQVGSFFFLPSIPWILQRWIFGVILCRLSNQAL